jgi:hypothetical protein
VGIRIVLEDRECMKGRDMETYWMRKKRQKMDMSKKRGRRKDEEELVP